MKYLIKFFTILSFLTIFTFKTFASNEVKIGLVIPLSGENKNLGETILNNSHCYMLQGDLFLY